MEFMNTKPRLSSRVIIVGVLAVLVAGTLSAAPVRAADVRPGERAPQTTAASQPRAYLSMTMNTWPFINIFGIETVNYTAAQTALSSTRASWIRRNALQWKDVEAVKGQRNWDAGLDADLLNARQNGQQVILIVHGTPTWARTLPTSTCSPIQPAQLTAFADFMRDAVNRYSRAPYNVRHWEIWNEPDAPAGPGINQPYGCWGDPSDPYSGGRAYADVLKAVVPGMRLANPAIQIVLGGLLLGCTPANCAGNEHRYLEGVIVNGGAPHFDIVSYHAYDFYDRPADVIGRYTGGSNWGTTSANDGPVLIAKTRFLRSELSRLGVTGKQLMNTEVGLLCFLCSVATPNFTLSKAYYVPQAYAAAIAESLQANVWYSYEGWNQSDLTGPAFDAFKVAVLKLQDVTYKGELMASDVGVAGVRGYRFERNGRDVWLMWSANGVPRAVTLNRAPSAITDALGASPAVSQNFAVDAKPLYIEFP
jgi:hypothetical protein